MDHIKEEDINIKNIFWKNLYWLVGVTLTVLFLVFTEGTMIMTTKLFGVVRATFLRMFFTVPLSWLVIYLSTKSRRSFYFSNWLAAKEAKLSGAKRAALKGGKFLAVINTAVFLGPIIASVLMLIVGVKPKKAYIYAALCAFLSAWVWSAFYSGMLCGLGRIFC